MKPFQITSVSALYWHNRNNHRYARTMIGKAFSIADFQPGQHTPLGEGLWGRVYDLGDGTVLKLARETCAGIGSGTGKIEREYAALKTFAAHPSLQGLLPQAIAKGTVPQDAALSESGFSLWRITTGISGRTLHAAAVGALPAGEKETVGRSVGRTLALLHNAMADSLPETKRTDADPYGTIKKEVLNNPFYTACIALLEKERSAVPADILNRPAHNDFNISNLLFAGHEVCGVLDFAEWGINCPEKDISDILKDCPSLADSMIRAYEQEAQFSVSERRLALGMAENALYGAVISERSNNAEGAKEGRDTLIKQLAVLGHRIAPPKAHPPSLPEAKR